MAKWADVKKTIHSISEERKIELEMLADLVSELVDKRIRLGWTQQQLADKAGLKQPAIARLENSENIPSTSTLFKVIHALGLKINLVEQDAKTKDITE